MRGEGVLSVTVRIVSTRVASLRRSGESGNGQGM